MMETTPQSSPLRPAMKRHRALLCTLCVAAGFLGMALPSCASVVANGAAGDNPMAAQADDKAPRPYVYDAENTGAAFPAPPLPTMDQATVIAPFPDPFAWAKDPLGKTRSAAFSDWSHHRAEIMAEIEHYEIGTKPAVDVAKQVTATFAANGATGGTLTVKVTVKDHSLTLTCAVKIPAGAKAPYPVIIGMNSGSGSLPPGDFSTRGIATCAFMHDQVTSYGRKKQANDPFFTLYGPDINIGNTGQYAAWAWGVSRVIDGLTLTQKDSQIDLKHIAVTGCSYAGKMALFAGAFDERVALTVAQESGGGGATNWRYSAQEKDKVEGLGQTDHSWFAAQMFPFAGVNVAKLPDDHNLLCALCAPRALYVTGNTGYTWLSNPSNYVNSRAVAKTYEALGVADRFGFCINGNHAHCQFPASQEPELQYFLDKFMLGKTDLTKTVATFPADYAKIDYERWTQWWGTGKADLPEAKVPAAAQQ